MVDLADPTMHAIIDAICEYWERRMLAHIIETGDSPEEAIEWMKQTIISEAN